MIFGTSYNLLKEMATADLKEKLSMPAMGMRGVLKCTL